MMTGFFMTSVSELHFSDEPLSTLLPALRRALANAPEVIFTVPDPEMGLGLYAGEVTSAGRHRPWALWAEVADLLGAHLLTPERLDGSRVRLRLRSLMPTPGPDALGYGAGSDWARVDKLEDPTFLLGFVEALRRVNPPPGGRVLSLGVNAGHELDALALG